MLLERIAQRFTDSGGDSFRGVRRFRIGRSHEIHEIIWRIILYNLPLPLRNRHWEMQERVFRIDGLVTFGNVSDLAYLVEIARQH